MSEDPLKKYWQNRRKEVSVTSPPHVADGPRYPGTIDIPNNPTIQLYHKPMATAEMMGMSRQTVDLKEGHVYFTQVQTNGFGMTASLAKNAGIISGNTSKNVILKQERIFYMISEGQVFDLSKISSQAPITLVEIEVPFLGTYFVSKESIIYKNNSGGNGRQILRG